MSSLQLNAIEKVATMANQVRTDKEKVVLIARIVTLLMLRRC